MPFDYGCPYLLRRTLIVSVVVETPHRTETAASVQCYGNPYESLYYRGLGVWSRLPGRDSGRINPWGGLWTEMVQELFVYDLEG